MAWKIDGNNEWIFKSKNMPQNIISQPFVMWIGLRDSNVDYFASHTPKHPIKGDYDYFQKGYQVEVGRFAGATKHLGYFKDMKSAEKRARQFRRTHKTLKSLMRLSLND